MPKFCKRIEICAFYDPIPGFKCSGTIRVFFRELQQSPSSDDVHMETISHGEMFVNIKSGTKRAARQGRWGLQKIYLAKIPLADDIVSTRRKRSQMTVNGEKNGF